jgi:hypothetical protein
MNPFRSKASVLSSLLELARGDVPGVLTNLRKHFTLIQRMKASGIKDASKALGSEYLNNVFGWSPILRDINDSVKVLLTLDQMLFPEDDTRRSVQRTISTRGAVLENTSVALSVNSPFKGTDTPGPSSQFYNSYSWSNNLAPSDLNLSWTGTGTRSVLETLSVWTTARFATNARPSIANNSHLDRAIDLLGLELTPEVIWELTPWSWLIDWFSNMGTVIGNLSTLGLSNTILNYAYSTARLVTDGSVWCKPNLAPSGNRVVSYSGNFVTNTRLEAKARMAASPFGFDVTLGALNAGQWAILTALGLARSR